MLDKILQQICEHAKKFNYTFTEHDKEELIALYEMNNDKYDAATLSLHIENYVQRMPQAVNSEWIYQRRPSVSARHVSPGTFALSTFDKTEDTTKFLHAALGFDIPFSLLTQEQKQKLVASMYPLIVEPGTVLIQQGDVGSEMYVIQEGEFEVLIDGQLSNKLYPGSCFGELALLHAIPRTATVRAVCRSRVWAAEQTSFSFIRICDQFYRKEIVKSSLEHAKEVLFAAEEDKSAKNIAKIAESASFRVFFPRNSVVVRSNQIIVVLKDARVESEDTKEYMEVSKGAIIRSPVTALTYFECAIVNLTEKQDEQ